MARKADVIKFSRYLQGYGAEPYDYEKDLTGSEADNRTATQTPTRPASIPLGSPPRGSSVERPEKPELPKYKAPKYKKSRVRALTQKHAAPGVRKLREAVQTAMGQQYDNPNVKRMTLREALQGYGTGLGDVMSAAQRSAHGEYMQELNLKTQEAMANYQAQVSREMMEYQMAWKEYLSSQARTDTGGDFPEMYRKRRHGGLYYKNPKMAV